MPDLMKNNILALSESMLKYSVFCLSPLYIEINILAFALSFLPSFAILILPVISSVKSFHFLV